MLPRYSPWINDPDSNPVGENIANAVDQRNRDMAMRMQNPGLPNVSPGAGWDAFWGGMGHIRQDAEDAGMNFRANYNGMGDTQRPLPTPASWGANYNVYDAVHPNESNPATQGLKRAQAARYGSGTGQGQQ